MDFKDSFEKFNLTDEMRDRFGMQAVYGDKQNDLNKISIKTILLGQHKDKLNDQGVTNAELG